MKKILSGMRPPFLAFVLRVLVCSGISGVVLADEPIFLNLNEGDYGQTTYTLINPYSFDLYIYGYGIGYATFGPDKNDALSSFSFADGAPANNTLIPAGKSINFAVDYTTPAADVPPDDPLDYGKSRAEVSIITYTLPNQGGQRYSFLSKSRLFKVSDTLPPPKEVILFPENGSVFEGDSGTLSDYIVNDSLLPFTITNFSLNFGNTGGDASDNLLSVTMPPDLIGTVIGTNDIYEVTINFTTPSDGLEDPVESGLNSVTLGVMGQWGDGTSGSDQGTGIVTVTDIPEPSQTALLFLGGLAIYAMQKNKSRDRQT